MQKWVLLSTFVLLLITNIIMNLINTIKTHLRKYLMLVVSLKKDTTETELQENEKIGKFNIQIYIRKMILRFANSISNLTLNSYHITFQFSTLEKKPSTYKLEIIAELRDDKECNILDNQIKSQLLNKFSKVNSYITEIKSQSDKTQIITQFQSNFKQHVSMKFIFRQWINNGFGNISKVIDNTIPNNGVKDYRVNILKTGNIPHNLIDDLFCVEIVTNDFK